MIALLLFTLALLPISLAAYLIKKHCQSRKYGLKLYRKTCLITGASHGIGLELSKHLLALGNIVINLDITSPPSSLFTSTTPNRYYWYECDVSCYQTVHGTFAQIQHQFPVLDLVVNNAGIYVGKALDELTRNEIESVLGTNLYGTFWVSQQALPLLRKAGGCTCLVVMASCLGLGGVAKMTDYCASKFGLFGFAEALRQEERGRERGQGRGGVNVITVCPYLVNTGMFKRVKIKFKRLMPAIATERLVKRIIKVIEKGENELWMPWFVNAVPVLRIFPVWVYDLVQNFLGANDSL